MAKASLNDELKSLNNGKNSPTSKAANIKAQSQYYKLREKEERDFQAKIEKIKNDYIKKNLKDNEKLTKEHLDNIQKLVDKAEATKGKARLQGLKDYYAAEAQLADTVGKKWANQLKSSLAGVVQSGKQLANNTLTSATRGIENYLGAYSGYMTSIEARLQGWRDNAFKSITSTISSNIGSSQYISQRKVMENLSNMVSQGIAYNIEQRAFLQTISDKIATTFDAANGTLLQLIRIQQADSTAARLGMEALLTQQLNARFKDTSYLSGLSDSVSASLLGTSSQLGRDRSLAFEYNVQKWLGSLSSVGVTDQTIQQLAQGLNYLGTGDISSLTSNTSLQNLLLMSAQASGIDYASILTGGITPDKANLLLQGIVKFSQQLNNETNQVVKAQLSNVFGLSLTDLAAMANLSERMITAISKDVLTYETAVNETQSQIKKIGTRMTIQDRVDTMFENIMSSMGESIANNAGLYTTYLVNNLIMDATGGGIEIPTPFVGPVNLNKIAQAGIVGYSLLANIGTIIQGLSGVNNLQLDNWKASSQNLEGAWGFTGVTTKGVSTSQSMTRYFGSSPETSELYKDSIISAETVQSQAGVADTGTQLAEGIDKSERIKDILDILLSWRDIGIKLNIDSTDRINNLFWSR